MKKTFLNETQKKAILLEREKSIIENFAKTFNKIKRVNENEINEYDNYPAGAKNDPRAPYNEIDPPEYKGFEIVDDSNDIDDFYIQLKNVAGGSAYDSLKNMLMKIKAAPEEITYFLQAVSMRPRPQDFIPRLEAVVEQFAKYADFNDYPEL